MIMEMERSTILTWKCRRKWKGRKVEKDRQANRQGHWKKSINEGEKKEGNEKDWKTVRKSRPTAARNMIVTNKG